MTTSPITCIRDTEIDTAKLGVLLHALATSDETALIETDYFDSSWASDVPNAPDVIDPYDTPDDPVGGSMRRGSEYRRVVAVLENEYIGFLSGRIGTKSAFIAIAAALHPGSGCGPKLLDTFAEMAVAAGQPSSASNRTPATATMTECDSSRATASTGAKKAQTSCVSPW
ncbi:hypothetical protein ACQGFJ_00005 [Rhodococcus sp. 3.70]